MAEEDLKGPMELTENKLDSGDSDDDNESTGGDGGDNAEEGDSYQMEKLRQYQLNRLKYYYAVIELDSVATADILYKECDGLEYESTATKLDLRFIPDDVQFNDEEPREVCTALPDMQTYKPRLFTTTALQQAKVELTWDEMNMDRKDLCNKLSSGKLDEVSDAELRRFVAYSSEEEEEGGDDDEVEREVNSDGEEISGKSSIEKYKNLLQEIQQKEEEKKSKNIEFEYSWGIGTQDKVKKLVEEKKKSKDSELTPFEKIIEKKKDKKKLKKIERKKKLSGKGGDGADNDGEGEEEDDGGWSSDDAPDDVDMNDPFFAEEFANGEFDTTTKKSKKKKAKALAAAAAEANVDGDKQIQAELALLMDDGDSDQEKAHFSLKKIQDMENETKSKSKRKKKLQLKRKRTEIDADKKLYEDNFNINVDDQRFSSIYTSHHFNIDPTSSSFKKTKGMDQIIDEKLKRRRTDSETLESEVLIGGSEGKKNKDVSMNLLVKSLKRKIKK